MTGFTPDNNRTSQQKARDKLFCHPCEDTPACVGHLYLIAWRFILTDFYQIHYDERSPPFDEPQAFSIYTRTIERYTILTMTKAHRTRATQIDRMRRGDPPPRRLIQRTNRLFGPLFHLDEDARLTISGKTRETPQNSSARARSKNHPHTPRQINLSTHPTCDWEPPSAPAESWSPRPLTSPPHA
jgi:hypothetical protein